MLRSLKRGWTSCLDHYAAACLIPALFILTLTGVGDVLTVSLLGLLLCGTGLTRGGARADLWILIPLLLYDLACLASAFAAYGTLTDGYGVIHGIFPVLYLLLACLGEEDRRLLEKGCALWAGLAAGAGIVGFVFLAVTQGRAGRMSGLLGNPNAMGIFLTVGWFICAGHKTEETNDLHWTPPAFLEPLLLMALAATLSMGSFAAMAAGILVLLLRWTQSEGWKSAFLRISRILAKASFGVGTGLLLYLAAARTGTPWLCLPLLAYGAAVMLSWKQFTRFLEAKPRMTAMIAALGILVTAAVIVLRPSAAATFQERLEMMGSGLHYLTQDPLFGVGPFQWRVLDLNDGGTYFNTWHIHNVVLHAGVEMGWIAMAMLVVIVLRALCKGLPPEKQALAAAFFVHNMIDTSFFYLGITALVLLTAGEPQRKGRTLDGRVVKILFLLLAGLFGYSVWACTR